MVRQAPLILLLALVLPLGGCSFGGADLDERIPVKAGGSLSVDLELGDGISFDKGSLEVSSHPAQEVRLVAEISGWGGYAVDLDLTHSSNQVRLVGRVEGLLHWAFGGPTVRIRAWVPQNFSVDARIDGGPILLEDLVGPIVARAQGSDLTLHGAEGPVRLSSDGGNIEVNDVEGVLDIENRDGDIEIVGIQGDLKAQTRRGSIVVRSVTGRVNVSSKRGRIDIERVRGDVKASSDRGQIEIEDVEGSVSCETDRGRIEIEEVLGTVNAKTARGGIEVEFLGNPSGHIETARGSVEIEIPEGAAFDLDVRTERGEIELDDFKLDEHGTPAQEDVAASQPQGSGREPPWSEWLGENAEQRWSEWWDADREERWAHWREEKERWKITLDRERCQGVRSCLEVCPEGVFEAHEGVREIDLANEERCIRCGACVVQCPMDALFFEDETGKRIEPEVIRRFKLNLLGKRAVDSGSHPESPA